MGGHSLKVTRLLSHIQKEFEITIGLKELFESSVLEDQALLIENIQRSSPLISTKNVQVTNISLLNAGICDENIFIIPGSDGMSEGYDELAKAFEKYYAVYGIQMVGLQENEIPIDSIEKVALKNIEWIKQIQPNGPYRLIGHSFGGLVLYEMAKQFGINGDSIESIVVLDMNSNCSPFNLLHNRKHELIFNVLCNILKRLDLIQEPYQWWLSDLKHKLFALDDKEIMMIINNVLETNLSVTNNDIQFIVKWLNLQVNNLVMKINMTDKLPYESIVIKASASEKTNRIKDKTLGWSKYFKSVSTYEVLGNHLTMIKGESANDITNFIMCNSHNLT